MTNREFDFEYLKQPPKRYTFEMPRVRKWVEKWSKGLVLNVFAGKTRLSLNEYRVDSNKEMVADYYGDAYEFVLNTDMKFDTIILDPPYSARKSMEKYNGNWISQFTKLKDELYRVMNCGCRIITFGYDSTGMSRARGCKKIALCLINHGASHKDTIAIVEEYYQYKML